MDKMFIERCFQLARMGSGNVAPNPMVGAVVVVDNKIIGEGYHKQIGSWHAEVNAINSVEDKSLLKKATVYVSLEPCSHFGKTPPCAKLLVDSQIKRCVIANFDPNPKVSGRGIQMLKDAGIEITCGVEEKQGRFLNRRFFCFQEKHRPYVILKFAQTLDGFMDIDRSNGNKQYWITNDAMKVFVHKMRKDNDAFFVGANTIINDNCKLNVRYFCGNNPIRVTYDKNLSLDKPKNFFDDSQKTIVFNDKLQQYVGENTHYIKISNNEEFIPQMLGNLYDNGISSLVVEGGKKTLDKFLQLGLWDEAIVITGNTKFGKGIKSPVIDTLLKASTSWVSDNRIDFFVNNNAF